MITELSCRGGINREIEAKLRRLSEFLYLKLFLLYRIHLLVWVDRAR